MAKSDIKVISKETDVDRVNRILSQEGSEGVLRMRVSILIYDRDEDSYITMPNHSVTLEVKGADKALGLVGMIESSLSQGMKK